MKKNILDKLGIPVRTFTNLTSTILSRYSATYSNPVNNRFQKVVWNMKPDPYDPETGWGLRISTIVSPLTGNNVEIVPQKSFGYKMDRTTDGSSWNNNAYSFTDISNLCDISKDSSRNGNFVSSVYCYVSNDFNGTWARISVEGNVSGKTSSEYDLSRKGVWQKLSICFTSVSIVSPVYLYWSKTGVSDFSSLKGYIIFAYPEYIKNKIDSKDPDSGWGTRISTRVFPLSGENVEIVPLNSIGYKMDSTCDASTWSNNAYSFTNISNLFQGDSKSLGIKNYCASVYCFVSLDFNGSWARISAEGNATGKIIQEYDLSRRGFWQKLELNFTSNSGLPPVYLYWGQNGVKDFSLLKGNILFAYPQYKILNKKDSASSFNIDTSKIRKGDLTRNNLNEYYKLFYVINTNQLYKILGISYGDSASIIKLLPKCKNKLNVGYSNNFYYRSSMLLIDIPIINTLFSNISNQDPIRIWASRFVSEDTTYYGYKKNLVLDTMSNPFYGARILRWKFAKEIFIKEYNLRQKILGGGFSFLNWYGYVFFKDKTKSDWPHNPFLFILLYSGMVGLTLYVLFLYGAFFLYFKYVKEYYLFLIFFLITFFFTFFSGGSPFDPPVMGFLTILPFFIHYVKKNLESF